MAAPSMRSAVLVEPERWELDELPRPSPGSGQVRVRLEGCGVCHSNLSPWEGAPWFDYPFEPGQPGHEGWGVIDAVGAGVTGLAEGDRVSFLSEHAYSEYDVADAAKVAKLPAELGARPFPGEPLGCAMNIFRRSDIQPHQTVAIVGIGFLGALLTRLAADAGAEVLAISRRPYSLDIASQMGAATTIEMDDHWRILDEVKDLTDERMCPRVIECVGQQWPLDLAGELTGERGRLIIAGYHQDGPRQINLQLWNWRGLDVINAHEREMAVYLAGMRDAAAAVVDGRLEPEPLFTHTLPLDELNTAFELMRDRPPGFLKALVTMEPS